MLLRRARPLDGGDLFCLGLRGAFLGVVVAALLLVAMISATAPPEPAAEFGKRFAAPGTRATPAAASAETPLPTKGARRRSVRLPGRTGASTASESALHPAETAAREGRSVDPSRSVALASSPASARSASADRASAAARSAQDAAASGDAAAPVASPEAAPTDPDLLVLKQLGVDLTHPDAEMRRLANEYRAGLAALENPNAAVDRARLARLDHGMAALLRVKPSTTGTVYSLFADETQRSAGRYFAMLLRGGDRGPIEPRLADMAYGDPDPARRASAVFALGPAPSVDGLPVVLNALQDPAPEVRAAAAAVVGSALLVQPALLDDPGVRASVQAALDAERDPSVRIALAQVLGPP